MAQVTLYLSDDIARRLKHEAKRAKKSLSAYVAELAGGERAEDTWPKWFFALEGSCQGTLMVPEDPVPEEPDSL
ncbi:MAG TPA: hypothetical protein VGM29_05535 [Polyangiaceae bacterium]